MPVNALAHRSVLSRLGGMQSSHALPHPDKASLNPVTLTNNAGQSKTLSLQYDGWMHGLPDLFEELRKNKFVMTADISIGAPFCCRGSILDTSSGHSLPCGRVHRSTT